MIEYLIALWIMKYREVFYAQPSSDDGIEDYGGIDFEPPARKRPDLRVVK